MFGSHEVAEESSAEMRPIMKSNHKATATLEEAKDAAKSIFREAASAPLTVRRIYATKSKHFTTIESLDRACFADFLAWLFRLDQKECPERWMGYGSNVSDQLLSYCYRRLSCASDDSLGRLMDAFREREFRGHLSSDIVALLKSLVERGATRPLKQTLLAAVEDFIKPAGPWPIYSRVKSVRQRESQNRRDMKRLYRALTNPTPEKAPIKHRARK